MNAYAPFRPLLTEPKFSWDLSDGRLEVYVQKGRNVQAYHVFPLATQLGGTAHRWHKLDGSGTVHDLTLNGPESSCDCEGWCFTGGCLHLTISAELAAQGVL